LIPVLFYLHEKIYLSIHPLLTTFN
jgi:hypothetical protein